MPPILSHKRSSATLQVIEALGFKNRSVPMRRNEILRDVLQIPYDEIKWVFISDYYDGPVEGLVRHKGGLFQFCCFSGDMPNQKIFVIHRLGVVELEQEIRAKEKFERMVGAHWSFDELGHPLPKSKRTEVGAKQYYGEQANKAKVEPGDSEVYGWFRVADGEEK